MLLNSFVGFLKRQSEFKETFANLQAAIRGFWLHTNQLAFHF